MVGKSIWVVSFYTFTNSIFATMLNGDEAVYSARAFRTSADRNKSISANGIAITLACAIVSIVYPQLMKTIGTTAAGWTRMILWTAVPLGIIGMGRFIFVKELDDVIPPSSKKLEAKDFINALKSNPYIYLMMLAALLSNLSNGIGTTVSTYYFTYIVGDLGKMSIVSMLSLAGLVVMPFLPMLLKKVSVSRLIMIFSAVGAIGSLIKFFAGANMAMLMAGNLLCVFAPLPMSYYGILLVLGCMDYSEWKTGVRVEGPISATYSFSYKVGTGIASALIGIYMGAAGFDGTAAVQTAAANSSIVALYSWIPMIFFIIIIVLMKFYKVDEMPPKIREELAVRRKQNS